MVENKDPMEKAIDKMKPILAQLSFGSVMGYCSGMALKKVGKAVAFVVGIGFVGLQTAVSMGYIDVDWSKVKNDALKPLDIVSIWKATSLAPFYQMTGSITNPGICHFFPFWQTKDGKINIDDVKTYWKKVKEVLTHKLPDAAGFSLGFLCGLKYS